MSRGLPLKSTSTHTDADSLTKSACRRSDSLRAERALPVLSRRRPMLPARSVEAALRGRRSPNQTPRPSREAVPNTGGRHSYSRSATVGVRGKASLWTRDSSKKVRLQEDSWFWRLRDFVLFIPKVGHRIIRALKRPVRVSRRSLHRASHDGRDLPDVIAYASRHRGGYHGCEWITNDRDYARFPGLRWRAAF